jgi:hypothetical protein
VGFFARHPVLKKVVANQYQAILVAGATAFSALTLSPLPLLLLAGAELMVAPFLIDRIRRRLEIEKKYAARQHQTLSQEQQFEALVPASKARFVRLRQLCERIQANYKGLSPASQDLLGDQGTKFDSILATCLRHLWLTQKYDEMIGAFSEPEAKADIGKLKEQLAARDLDPRVREALEKNLDIKEQLLQTVRQNVANRQALLAEVNSLESLLQLLLQKSIAATDATAFSLEVDDVLARAEADAASVEEMERLFGAIPELSGTPRLSDRLKQMSTPPPPPPPARGREGRRR